MSRDKKKLCYVCEEMKPMYYFHKNDASADGHLNICKSCQHNREKARRRNPWATQVSKLLAGWGR